MTTGGPLSTTAAAPAPTWPFTIVINTCRAYASTALPMLMQSLAAAGVPVSQVVVVCGQCGADEAPEVPVGVRLECREYTAEAMTGLIALSESDLVATPWVLYVQDTMMVGPQFPFRALQLCDAVSPADTDCVRLLDMFSLSVGLYSTAWLRGLDLSGFKRLAATKEDMQRIKTWSEDRVFGLAESARSRHLAEFGNPADRVLRGDFRYTPESPRRVIEHYPVLDLYKLKSWDGDVERVGVVEIDGQVMPNIPVGV